jgi:hypothetical protein
MIVNIMNWNSCGRKRSLPTLSNYPALWVKGLRKTIKTLRTVGVPAEVLIEDIPNSSVACYRHAMLLDALF